ncbi:MAG: D-2-hydroxyacid dehydrogenase [Lachnospiraceae bacterium]|nr:D-2-hydroxyacid dehydrogenase [Lachnospiraceae bacterium]
MKISILERDSLGIDVDMSEIDKLGEVTVYPATTVENAVEHIGDADILIVNKLPLNENTLKEAKNLKFVAQTATGTNNVDFNYTNSRGIKVANVPSYSTDSVAQHTFALLLYLVEKMRFFDDYVKNGTYSRSNCFSCLEMIYPEIAGKTWGIIGMGAIGQKVAQIATVFGCKVICYSASGRTYDMPYEQVDFDTLLSSSDIVSVHAPLNEHTKDLMNYEAFVKMKESAYFINVGRGPIVVEEDLARALEEGQIRAAGLDVLRIEPMNADNPLLKIQDSQKLIITPHVAWATSEARQRCVDVVAENIKAFLRGEEQNIVRG